MRYFCLVRIKFGKGNKLAVFVKRMQNSEMDERESSTLVSKLIFIYAYCAHENSTQTDLQGFTFLPDFHG